MTEAVTLQILAPIIVLLLFGVASAVVSRAVGLSPIVGYVALGLAINAMGFGQQFDPSTIALLADVGVMFLLFDIGLHFALTKVREHASDIFAFGSVQVLFATLALGLVGWLAGLSALAAPLVGAILSLSSTAVVGRLIEERHQINCPVGTTATAILIFQDVAAMFLLILVGALGDGKSMEVTAALALGKAVLALVVTILASRLLVHPLLKLIARHRSAEVFTATALLVALSAGWATGEVGLSVTLGAFLGGLALSETAYRPVISAEIKPFRGLLLGFFFVSIGLSLSIHTLISSMPAIVLLTASFLVIKTLANIAASRMFRWSAAGSTQLGFLLAQGSEFAFVILAIPAVQGIIGTQRVSVLIAAVTLSIAVTPNVADAGRRLAGRLRMRSKSTKHLELVPTSAGAPIIIVGMGTIGRAVADALRAFRVEYTGVEHDQARLQLALADGYEAAYGDGFDISLWESLDLHARQISVLTTPDVEVLSQTAPLIREKYPALRRIVSVRDASEADTYRSLGLQPVVETEGRRGEATAVAVLGALGIPTAAIVAWVHDRRPADQRQEAVEAAF